MILEVLDRPKVRRPVREALRGPAEGEPSISAGEERLVLSGVSWERYLEVDAAFEDDRQDPRLYYLEGELEIMSTSVLHDKIKKWLGDFIGDFLFESGLEAFPHGQATLRGMKQAAAEPDESWCLHADKAVPDIVLEVALTSGGIDKLEIYRHFAIPEVWIWRKGALEFWMLRSDGTAYDGPAKRSRLLPNLDPAMLAKCSKLSSWREARRMFRESLRQGKA